MTFRQLLLIGYSLSTLLACADTIELTDGRKITGTITGYANMTFEAVSDKGQALKLPAATVKHIVFGDRVAPSRLETRTGNLDAKLVEYVQSTFLCESRDGKPQVVKSVLVNRILLARETKPDEATANGKTFTLPGAISHGEAVPLESLLTPGKVTVVFFFGSLGQQGVQCQLVNAHLDNVVSKQSNIAIRKVDIGEWESEVAAQYKVTAIPRLDIYDSTGKLFQTILGHRPGDLTAALKKVR